MLHPTTTQVLHTPHHTLYWISTPALEQVSAGPLDFMNKIGPYAYIRQTRQTTWVSGTYCRHLHPLVPWSRGVWSHTATTVWGLHYTRSPHTLWGFLTLLPTLPRLQGLPPAFWHHHLRVPLHLGRSCLWNLQSYHTHHLPLLARE